MSGFNDARKVEAEGMAILLPFLEERADGRLVLTHKGALARHLQLVAGDVLFNDTHRRDDRLWSVEIKIEQRHTGNLFLETWSNRNLDDKDSFHDRGGNRGWLDHLRADLLFYYFLDTDDLYIIDLFTLKRWAFGYIEDGVEHAPNLDAYTERPQGRYRQRNDTHGRIVPIAKLQQALGSKMKQTKAKQRLLEFGLVPLGREAVV